MSSCPLLPPSTGLASASVSSQRKEGDSDPGSWVVLTPKHAGKSHAVSCTASIRSGRSRGHRDEQRPRSHFGACHHLRDPEHLDVRPMLQAGHPHWGSTLLVSHSTQCPEVRSYITNTGRQMGWSFLDASWETEDQHPCNPTRIREVRTGCILPSHLAGSRRVGVGLPASSTEIPGRAWASKSKPLDKTCSTKGPLVSILEVL